MSREGIEMDPRKVSAIHDWPQPQMVTEVCSFLGFTNYYRKFIYRYVQIMKPLNALVSSDNAKGKEKLVKWNEDCAAAFWKLKELCSVTPIYPMLILKSPFLCKWTPARRVWGLFVQSTG